MKSSPEVADIFRAFGEPYRQVHGKAMPLRHYRVMRAIEICRTAALGGHVDACEHCGAVHISYNSCRNRHCPKCQFLAKERWLEARRADLLPVRYFHVVFTLPGDLRSLALRNQEVVYNLLFQSASEALKELSRDPRHLGAEIGLTALLHTWSQTLMDHPHLHCVVPGGGLSLDGQKWIGARKEFFIPVKVISRLFRGKFLAYLKKAYESDRLKLPGVLAPLEESTSFNAYLSGLYHQEWNVYCKRPFGGAQQVIDYLARYTHRVAISNDRIVKLEGDQVTFRYRDWADRDRVKEMRLPAFEFIRRFLLHVLPDGFVKIRHYGVLSNRSKKTKLLRCRQILGVTTPSAREEQLSWEDLLYRLTGVDARICPHCGKGRMVLKEILQPQTHRSPPQSRTISA